MGLPHLVAPRIAYLALLKEWGMMLITFIVGTGISVLLILRFFSFF